MSDVMSPKEVAEFFKKSVDWVYKYKKELGCIKLPGNAVAFSRKRILGFLETEKSTVARKVNVKGIRSPYGENEKSR